MELIERRFEAHLKLEDGIDIVIDSLDMLYQLLPKDIKVIDRRATTEIIKDSIYFTRDDGIIAIKGDYILDRAYKKDLSTYSIYSCLYATDINTGKTIDILLDEDRVVVGTIEEIAPEAPQLLPLIKHHLLGEELEEIEYISYPKEKYLIKDPEDYVHEVIKIVIESYCELVMEANKEYIKKRFPLLIKAYELYKRYGKEIHVDIQVDNVKDLLFINNSFSTIDRYTHKCSTLSVIDNRLEYLPPGPYYCLNTRASIEMGLIGEVIIEGIYSRISSVDERVNIYTCIDYREKNTQLSGTWYGHIHSLAPLVQSNIYLLFKKDVPYEEFYRAYTLSGECKVEAPYIYPFKYRSIVKEKLEYKPLSN